VSPGRRRLRRRLGEAALVGITLLVTAAILVPVVWMFSAAVRPISELLTYPPRLIPDALTADYFLGVLRQPKYQRFFANSVMLCLASLAVTLLLGALAAAIGLLAGLPTLVAVFLRVTEIGPRPGQGPAPSWHRCSATARCSRPPPSP